MYVIYDIEIDGILEDTRMDDEELINKIVDALNSKKGYERYFVSIQKKR